ncbi:hypothetical protein G6F66_001703 [Rhizopus arrhizus]|nr:hypothetical protein G6F66_001703 [Rhizopus arrhizus]
MLLDSIVLSTLLLCTCTLAASVKNAVDPLSACYAYNHRAKRVKESFLFAYNGYKKCAWGHDELLPVNCQYSDSRNHWGATIVDGLDTMLIMGLEKEYNEALSFISSLDFKKSETLSKGFETNIRYLGGLLAANDLRPNHLLVTKAVELAEAALVPLFVKTTRGLRVPYTNMNLKTGKPEVVKEINLAEFGTYTMEFTRLSQVTGDLKYERLAMDLTKAIMAQPTKLPGLYPNTWTVDPFLPVESSGGGDSFYEYLIKNYLLQESKDKDLLTTWQNSVESIEKYLLSPTAKDPSIQFVAMLSINSVYYASQELICFWPGNILLGITQVSNRSKKREYLKLADVFFKSCIETWIKTTTGIAPESWTWTPANDALETRLSQVFNNTLSRAKVNIEETQQAQRAFTISNPLYDLRPETIESIFYYYRLTGKKMYQDLAWELYLSIDRYTKTAYGYTAINNVDKAPSPLENFQESFLFAETMKYLYLIFTNKNCISLDDYVFNTEAHPFKLPQSIRYQY